MTLTVLYFAKARELAGTSEERIQFTAEPPTLRRLMQELTQRHPLLAGALECMRVARNEEFAELDDVAAENDVIALIPPVAGG
ncbi:MAG TPA: molybdopterin converting factor subunit 1 [Polyangiaceae bacterium]|nr:molybdopterin converting factor subunit 1 [Polyangiaceae bacterium]